MVTKNVGFVRGLDDAEVLEEALLEAAEISLEVGRRHVVRDDFGSLWICPLYELGKEGLVADAGYQAYGVLVEGQGR